jgi:cysteinyl-tRNA synthetase
MANVWMHNGFLQVEGQKMSKSLGNFVTIRELLGEWRGYAWPGPVIRFAMLATHYRQPIDFSQDQLEQAWIALSGFKTWAQVDFNSRPSPEFMDALNDDLNTPRAIAELHRLQKVSREAVVELGDRMLVPGAMLQGSEFEAAHQLGAGLALLGIDIDAYDRDWAKKQRDSSGVDALVAARNGARKAKNFKEADRIRDELSAMGIQLKDSKDPKTGEVVTTWEVKG